MKILFVITRADTVGGAQVHVRDLSKALIDLGHNVHIITGQKGIYNQDLDNNSIPYTVCDFLLKEISLVKDIIALKSIVNLIQKLQPDIISTHSSKAGILGRVACKLLSKPCIFTAHGWAFTEGVPEPTQSIYRYVEKFAEKLADKIICVSDNDRQIGLAAGMSSQRLVTVHNGMPDVPESMHSQVTSSLPIQITMIARFDRQKDHISLLNAIQPIQGIQLNLVGDGPMMEETKSFCSHLGITDRVLFLGFQRDVSLVLAKSHIFTLISNWEGFPRTIIEAMRAGLPVIASDVGGVAEAVTEDLTGYCIPRGNIGSLRDSILKLVNDSALREFMGYQARQKYEKEFTFDSMLQKNLSIYQDIISKYR